MDALTTTGNGTEKNHNSTHNSVLSPFFSSQEAYIGGTICRGNESVYINCSGKNLEGAMLLEKNLGETSIGRKI